MGKRVREHAGEGDTVSPPCKQYKINKEEKKTYDKLYHQKKRTEKKAQHFAALSLETLLGQPTQPCSKRMKVCIVFMLTHHHHTFTH